MPEVWSKEEISKLIKLYRRYPILYDVSNTFYRNFIKRQECLIKIVAALKPHRPDINVTEIKKKIKNLRTMFTSEMLKLETSSKKAPSLWYFDDLKFLESNISPRKQGFSKRKNDVKEKIASRKSSKSVTRPSSSPQLKIESTVRYLPPSTQPPPVETENTNRKCGEIYVNDIGLFTYICYECDQEFSDSKILSKHILSNHFIKTEKREIHYDEQQEEDIKTMNNDDEDFFGDYNQNDFSTNSTTTDLTVIKLDVHHMAQQETVIEKPYKCYICGKCFRFERILIGHIKISHNQIENETDDKSEITIITEDNSLDADAIINCNLCTQQFTTMARYNKHVKRSHVPVVCPTCGAVFNRKRNLDGHIRRMHSDLTLKYICDLCSKGFKEKGNLLQHLRTHTKEKPFKCDRCDKSFGWSSYLRIHRRMHIKSEMVYVCEQCGARFASNGMLNIHMKLHNNVRRFKCDQCCEKYYRIESLKRHLLKHFDGTFVCKICDRDCKTTDWLRDHKCFSATRAPRKRTVGLDVEKNIETISTESLLPLINEELENVQNIEEF